MTSLARILYLYYVFIVLRGLAFFAPVWALFLQSKGFNVFWITVMDIIFWITIALAEIPTGSIADKVSRKISILIGSFLVSSGVFIFGFANNIWVFVSSYVIWAGGITFWSGADQAFLYDTLKSYKEENKYQQVYGRVLFLGMIATAVSSLFGGFLATFDLSF
ncbi:MAG: hypothetical protein ACFFCQ_14775, partial [Promethearchaeota archaeon]